MHSFRFLSFVSACVALFCAPLAFAQTGASLAVRVTDTTSQSVLRGAAITVTAAAGEVQHATTNVDGELVLPLAPGQYTVTVDYLGYPPKTEPVEIRAGQASRLNFALGNDIALNLGTFKVEGARTGQARALNQQRTAQTLTNIISSDLSGQFPDKNIADAVKRLPGITVETDRDTGGAEGRYITVRGMSADFNAVTIDGMRVNVTDFDGITRRVPLDVVSSDVADQIEVSKALRPDQDADSIGGAVNIRTRSAFGGKARTASFKAALGYSDLLTDYTGNYPYDNPGSEMAASYSQIFGAADAFGLSISANTRERAFVKQRSSTTGWNNTLGYRLGTSTTVNPLVGYAMDSAVLQHYFDDVTNYGFNGSFEWRPTEAHKLRFLAGTNARETNRGRQRQQLFFPLARSSDGTISTTVAPTLTGDTYTAVSSAGNTVRKEVRDFEELQVTSTVALDGESRLGDNTLNYLVGYNWAHWDGGLDSALQAQFQNAGFTTSYAIAPGQAQFPDFAAVQTTTGLDRNDPGIANVYTMRSLVRGSREYWDGELNAALDFKRPATVAGLPGFFKVGLKTRNRSRDFNSTQRSYNANSAWNLLGYTGQSDIGSMIADYGAKDGATSDGHYNYGYFLDPAKVRAASDLLIARGLLTPSSTNAFNSLYDDYSATEDILAAYAEGQFSRGPLTVLAGVRVEGTRMQFDTFNVVDGLATAIQPTRNYTDVLPGVHARYDLGKNTFLRAAYTESLARPTFNQLNPRATISTTSDTVSRGNIDLKRVYARNFDLSLEHYFGSVGYVSAGVFHKQYKNNVYRSTQSEIFEGELARVTQPRNARGGELTGIELAVDRRLEFLPAPFDGFGVMLNYTYVDSSLDSGLPLLAGVELPLFDQVENTVNASLYYEKGPLRLRASLHHRSETLFELATDNPLALARYEAPSTTLDVTGSYKLWRNWSVYVELSNLTNEPSHGYNGDADTRLDYTEFTGWSGLIGLRWNL